MAIDNEEFAAFIKFGTRDIPPHPNIGRRILRQICEVEASNIVTADKSTLASAKKRCRVETRNGCDLNGKGRLPS